MQYGCRTETRVTIAIVAAPAYTLIARDGVDTQRVDVTCPGNTFIDV